MLEARGWQVLERRWRGGGGEIDLIVRRDAALRFVEVRLRSLDDPAGLESVTPQKVGRVERAAETWLADYPGPVREACLMVALLEPIDGELRLTLLDDPV